MSAAQGPGATYVVTFYSFKGGVGRTHAAVNVAAQLASEGLRVLLVDFDLEAPGLTYLPALAPRSAERPGGVVEFLADSWAARQTQDVAGYAYEVEGFGGRLFVMPAGAVGTPRFAQSYAQTHEFFAAAFDRTKGAPGLALFNDLKHAWALLEYDYVIVDSRTGFTDIGGVCTRLLPDLLVLMFGLGEQGLPGARQVLDQVGHETLYGTRIDVRLVASMLPVGELELREKRLVAVETVLGRRPDFLLPIFDRLLLEENVRHFEDRLAYAYRSLTQAIRSANRWDVRHRLGHARERAGDADPAPLEALVVDLASEEAEGLPARLRWETLGAAAVSLLRTPAGADAARLRVLKTGTAALRLVRSRVERHEQWPEAFLPDLATSLDNLGAMLSALGQREEAAAAMREAAETRHGLAAARHDRVERTFMFTDLVMSTDVRSAFIEQVGEHQGNERFRAEVLLPHNQVIEDRVREHEGGIVSTAGDSYFVVFRDARRAIECAVAIQRAFVGIPIPIAQASGTVPRHVQVRIGVHTGVAAQVLVEGRVNYDDQAIAVAHRIEEHAAGEQILVSEDTWKKAGRFETTRRHEHSGYVLKGVLGKWTLVEILWDDRKPRRPEPRTGAADSPLLQRYLREVWDTSVRLKLTTIDLKTVTGSREATELDLAAVFTDLEVQDAPEGLERLGARVQSGVTPRGLERLTRETGRLAVTEALSRHQRVVVLGDPGSGKSTLMNFLALCLAGEGLGRREVNAGRLGEAWKLPRLLPIRILLRDYAARGLADKGLWEFFKDELAAVRTEDGDLSLCLPEIEEALRRPGGAILLLDGIDEVPEANRRRVDLRKAIERFARDFEHCRIVVTSRPYAYDDPEARLANFDVRTLVDFTSEQIDAFIGRWYAQVGEKDRALGRVNADRYAAQLRRVVKTHPRVAELARRPLLLALMASLHRWNEGGALPDRRQELYEKSVDLLIDLWQREKNLFDQQGQPVGKQQYDVFTELGIRREKLRAALNRLAFEAHRDQPVLTGTHDITAGQLAGALYEAADDKGKAQFERVIEYVTDRAGLLIERVQGAVYSFPHRTFQEYLAACHLAGPDFPYELTERLRADDQRWREVALLAAAKAVSGSPSAIWTLIKEFCPADWGPTVAGADADWYAALRATQALVESEQERKAPDRQQFLIGRLHGWLLQLVTRGALPPRERAEAGLLLNRLPGGDPRVANDEWVEVGGGEFTMGTTEEEIARLAAKYDWAASLQKDGWYDDERASAQRLTAYRIGKYPVTNAQYSRFVDAGAYRKDGERYWSEAGRKWRQTLKRAEPEDWNATRFNAANQPVVGVSWYEAEAYCNWLMEHLRKTRGIEADHVVRLPRETEWEFAARGDDGRTWPWGNEWDENRANTREGGLRQTTPVGIYPDGASPFKALDMAGNVWEWCDDAFKAGDTDARRLRGGAWYYTAVYARSASRLDVPPDYADDLVGFRCVVVPHAPLR